MATESERYRVTAAVALNIRAAPSITSRIIAEVTRDQIIEKIAESPDGFWIRHKKNGVEGWSSKKYLVKIADDSPNGDSPWLTIAGREYGVVEFPGRDHNPRVLEYLSTITDIAPRWRSFDETSWCSAFVNWCMERAGYPGTKSALATSWLSWGKKIDTPVKGCITIFSRNKGGHVGFYIDETPTLSETYIRIFGGNQEHVDTNIGAVNLKYYQKSRLLGYRLPK